VVVGVAGSMLEDDFDLDVGNVFGGLGEQNPQSSSGSSSVQNRVTKGWH
jgi:hypothetical protein